MTDTQNVFIVDDDTAVLDSLKWLLESVGLSAVGFATAHAFLEHVAQNGDLHGCLVVDLRLPGLSGLDLLDQLNERGVSIPALMITGHGDVPAAVRAMKLGAIDFIEKPFNDEVLLGRIRAALAMDTEQSQLVENYRVISKRYETLTPREREVMSHVVKGKLNKQVATALGLSHKTIEVHRSHVMNKMEAGSLAQLVRMSISLEQNED